MLDVVECPTCKGKGTIPPASFEVLKLLFGALWTQFACTLLAVGLLQRFGASTYEAAGGALLCGSLVGAVLARGLRIIRGAA
jgi:hypothetical protein